MKSKFHNIFVFQIFVYYTDVISVWRIHTEDISVTLMKVMRKFLILMRLQQVVVKTKQLNFSDLITVSVNGGLLNNVIR